MPGGVAGQQGGDRVVGPGRAQLLAAEPAMLTSIRIGYARVSTSGQNLERQLDVLRAAGCRRVFAEKKSGRDTARPELAACLEFMAPGDTLVVPSLDRLSRSLQDLITTVGDLLVLGKRASQVTCGVRGWVFPADWRRLFAPADGRQSADATAASTLSRRASRIRS